MRLVSKNAANTSARCSRQSCTEVTLLHACFCSCAVHWQDTNMGLVRQVVASLVKRNIQRLTQTYMTLSLTDIASSVGLASAQEAELHVLRCGCCCLSELLG